MTRARPRAATVLGFLAGLLCIFASQTARAQTDTDPLAQIERRQQALFERVAPSVVYIVTQEGIGSGFFVGTSGLVLTNAHVVGKRDRVDVVLHDGRKVVGRVTERARDDVDLALIQLPLQGTPPLSLSVSRLRVGMWVASVGHGLGGSWTFTTGMISNIYALEDKGSVFQTQIPLNPGNSGGPIFDRAGQVVGIVTAGMGSANSINFGIRSETALASLGKLDAAACRCLVILAPRNVPIFVNGKTAGAGPRLLLPAEPREYEVFAVVGGQMRKRKVTYPRERQVDLR